ncbi:MAG: Hpt domain-containing protein [Pseudolabrys sp.]|nr:Hpt domain-containing protein [Pseudolabrys sp.]
MFDRQAATLMTRMRTASPALAFSLAHTLKMSARSVGAWHVAWAAESVELADGIAAEAELAQARLVAAVDEARLVIAELLRAH